jgi:hypothetical protein
MTGLRQNITKPPIYLKGCKKGLSQIIGAIPCARASINSRMLVRWRQPWLRGCERLARGIFNCILMEMVYNVYERLPGSLVCIETGILKRVLRDSIRKATEQGWIMHKQFLNPPGLPKWEQSFSQAVVVHSGTTRTVYLSGKTAVNADNIFAADRPGYWGNPIFELDFRRFLSRCPTSHNLSPTGRHSIY